MTSQGSPSTIVSLFPTTAPSRFEELWKSWPTKSKKILARAKYDAILRGRYRTKTVDKDSGTFMDIEIEATEEQILAGAAAYLRTQKATGSGSYGYIDGGKWIPHLATFLNSGRFMDHL